MQSDTIKLITANVVAGVLSLGSYAAIIFLFLNSPVDRDPSLLYGILGTAGGAATQYLWTTNTQSAARAQTRSDLGVTPPDGTVP